MGDNRVQVCVVGPGALGCLHAALLARAGVRVSLLDYRPDRAEHIRRHGLTVEGAGETWTASVLCSALPHGLPPADVLAICVKTHATAAALKHVASLVAPDTVLLRLQNGLPDPRPLAEAASADRVVLGTSGHGANAVGWGHIRYAGPGPTRIGALSPQGEPAVEAAADALRPAFPDIEIVDDVGTVLWGKLLVNASVNPLTALTGLRNGCLLDVPLLQAALRDLASETETVGRFRGIPLTSREGVRAADAACRQTADNRSSMLQDVQAGRRTEIADICGAVVREAHLAGSHAPLNAAVAWLVSEVLRPGETNTGRPNREVPS